MINYIFTNHTTYGGNIGQLQQLSPYIKHKNSDKNRDNLVKWSKAKDFALLYNVNRVVLWFINAFGHLAYLFSFIFYFYTWLYKQQY